MPIQHPAWRAFEASRIASEDGGEALLLGLRLGRDALENLPPVLRKELLPEVVNIEGAERLNRPADDVIQMMRAAERQWATTSIPYAIAVFNEFLVTAVEMLQADGQAKSVGDPSSLMLGPLRCALKSKCNVTLPADYDELMWFVQALRNDIIHAGGRVSPKQQGAWKKLTSHQQAIWWKAAKRTPQTMPGRQARLGPGEARAVLAVTGRLTKALNEQLGQLISRPAWALIAVNDWRNEHPSKWAEKPRRAARAVGYARMRYGAIGLTADEIEAALKASQ